MKWNNPGHEFDELFENIITKKYFYLFGAGDYGRQFQNIFKDEIHLLGYIDNDLKKQKSIHEGLKCYSLEEIEHDDNVGIVVTMSQIARTEPIQQLIKNGYKKDKDFFIIEEFISVYFIYKYDKVYFSSISFVPSTVCNLNCRYCLNFNPFAKKYYTRKWRNLIADIDRFFTCVDHIMLFHVSGGEPMLYKYTADLIEYIDNNYRQRIDTLRLVTNGTMVPSEEMLERLSKCRFEITVDDYRMAVPQYKKQFEELVNRLKEYQIKYYINKVDSWIDLAPEKTDYSGFTEEQLIQHRTACNQSWQELRDEKLYNCNYAAYATVAGIAGDQDLEEVFDLTKFATSRKKELIEFRLGYTTKGYTNFCKKCRGFTPENINKVEAALQVKQEYEK